MKTAPIVLFVYNRPWHTQQTVEALQKNKLAQESELFIYSDAAKNDQASEDVEAVREYIETIKGFKKVTLIKRDKNWGLADSIIDGVTKIVNEYGKIIVLEDDLVTSPYFLNFMNDALEFYKDERQVWHISGWNYPMKTDDLADVFLWRLMNCWGWATWVDRWQYYEKDTDKVINEFTKKDINRFNLDGTENFFSQVIANKQNKINTWATYWYACIFKKDGLCLNPARTYVENIGLDGSGENCGDTNIFSSEYSKRNTYRFTSNIEESSSALKIIKDYYMMKNKTKFGIFLDFVKKTYKKEQFNPSPLGIFVNPFFFSRKELSSSIIALLPQLRGVLLDIGCGSKPYELFCTCEQYIGLELDSPENRERNRADYYYDGDEMPFKAGSVDSVLTSQVFEHVFTPDSFLSEINRIMKKDGMLLLTVPLAWAEHEQPYDYARYTSFGLKYILEKHGFEIIKFKKTANNFSAIVQIFTSYIQKKMFGKNERGNLVITILLISPIHILGLVISKLLPADNDFYLDNVVLAKKIKDEG